MAEKSTKDRTMSNDQIPSQLPLEPKKAPQSNNAHVESQTLSSKISYEHDSNTDDTQSSCSKTLSSEALPEDSGRERLKRHRTEVAGRVWIPETWGQEELLKDWIDCSGFDASLGSKGIMSAREALAEEGRRANSGRLRIENRC